MTVLEWTLACELVTMRDNCRLKLTIHSLLYVRVKAAAETLPFPARADTECAAPALSSPGVNPRLPRQKTEAPGARVFSLECILPRDTL
jgi:hypothetical protein